MTEPLTLTFFVAAFLFAGTIKGIIGIGLPTTALGLTTLLIEPRLAISLVLVPMLVTNVWQLYRAGDLRGALRRYWLLTLVTAIGVLATVFATAEANDRLLLGILGGVFLIFVAVNATAWAPRIGAAADMPAQTISGAIAGVMGGLTAVWMPPIAIYLAARDVGKEEFVRASGLFITAGSIPLAYGYAAQGFVTRETLIISFGLLVPALLGFSIGEALRGRISEARFRKVLLVFFAVIALNLIRRAVV